MILSQAGDERISFNSLYCDFFVSHLDNVIKDYYITSELSYNTKV